VNFLYYSLLWIVPWFISPAMHPIHVSVCNMDLNNKENIVSVKLFKDDFALALNHNYQVNVEMDKADEETNRLAISRYINSCLQIVLNENEVLKLDYKSSEINEEAIWIYFQTGILKDAKKLSIKNTLMLDIWDDQTNLLIISRNGKESGYRFNRNVIEIEIDLNKE